MKMPSRRVINRIPTQVLCGLCALVLTSLCTHAHVLALSDPIIVAVGDIACSSSGTGDKREPTLVEVCRQTETSDVALQVNGLAAVLTLGDNQYPSGAIEDFHNSYDRSWGRLKSITHPSMGNHEGLGEGYYTYFGAAAGSRDQGYYSFDIGAWHRGALRFGS